MHSSKGSGSKRAFKRHRVGTNGVWRQKVSQTGQRRGMVQGLRRVNVGMKGGGRRRSSARIRQQQVRQRQGVATRAGWKRDVHSSQGRARQNQRGGVQGEGRGVCSETDSAIGGMHCGGQKLQQRPSCQPLESGSAPFAGVATQVPRSSSLRPGRAGTPLGGWLSASWPCGSPPRRKRTC